MQKIYYNQQGRFCVSYPSRWTRGEAFDGAGIFMQAGANSYTKPLAEMDVATLSMRADTSPESTNLLDDLQMHLDALKKFERAEELKVLEQRDIHFFGGTALFVKDRYYDAQDGVTWINELILTQHSGMLYRLELTCRADQASRFQSVFSHLVSTFQFDCPARGNPKDVFSSGLKRGERPPVTRPIPVYPGHAGPN